MNKQEFLNMLENHDWTYAFSDDFMVWESGEKNENKLKDIASKNDELADLFVGYHNHVFSGPAYGTEKAPKPTV